MAPELEPPDIEQVASRAAALRDLGQFDEADEILAAAIRRFAPVQRLLYLYAEIAQDRGYLPEALRRWQGLLFHFPDEPTGYRMIVQILSTHLQRHRDAERVLMTAMARFPDRFEFLLEHATLASSVGDWPLSLRRWQILAARYPDHALIALRRGDAELRVQLGAIDKDGDSEQDVIVSGSQWIVKIGDTSPGDRHRALMMQFESLGANCEFGLVQRYFGAEPLGLLRWASIHPVRLAQMLEQRLEGLGESDTVELLADGAEYILKETRFDFRMHSFLYKRDTAIDPVKLRLQFARRLRLLTRKLLEDLADAQKIFVYQHKDGLRPDQMARLHQAVRAFGPNTILFVGDGQNSPGVGEVECVAPGWLIGSIDRLVHDGNWSTIAVDSWLRLCLAARAAVPAG